MTQVFGAFAALAIGWGLCAPAHAQELFPLQFVPGGTTISVTPTSVAASGSITIDVANGLGNPGDWIGIYAAGSPNNDGYVSWDFTNGTQTEPGSGSPTAHFTMTAPSATGPYDVRLQDGSTVGPPGPYPMQASASLTVTGGGGGGGGGTACTSSDSGFVPAGYNCVVGVGDEFNGSTLNTSKWILSGCTDDYTMEGTYVALHMRYPGCFNNYTGGSITGTFNLPDAPSYIEWRRRYVPHQTLGGLVQMWTNNAGTGTGHDQSTIYGQEETDADMGEGCGSRGAIPGTDPTGECSGWPDLTNPAFPFFHDYQYGSTAISDGSDWHVIGMQRLPTPAPNGSVVISLDGTPIHTMYANLVNAFPSSGGTGFPDVFIANMFAGEAHSSGNDMELDIDYVRVYTP